MNKFDEPILIGGGRYVTAAGFAKAVGLDPKTVRFYLADARRGVKDFPLPDVVVSPGGQGNLWLLDNVYEWCRRTNRTIPATV